MLAAASLASVLRGEVTEQEAEDLYEQTYRQAYLRLLVIVSSLYQQYRGKESYFWEAQRLTLHDCSATDLKQAFVNVVSGIEDLRDAQATLDLAVETTGKTLAHAISQRKMHLDPMKNFGSTSPEEQELTQARRQFFDSVMMRHSPSPQKKDQGLYVVTKPRLGLAHQSL
jgi:hypothetical protein